MKVLNLVVDNATHKDFKLIAIKKDTSIKAILQTFVDKYIKDNSGYIGVKEPNND